MATIAILGTGLLGAGFAENLLDKGHSVRVWNRSRAKLAPLAARGAYAAEKPADAARGADRIHLVLEADDAVDAVIAQIGEIGKSPILDHSTNLPARVRERAEQLAAAGAVYLHCPVFMGPANARNGTGIMLIAGAAAAVAELTPALASMTGKVWHCGERADAAAVYKLIGNATIIGIAGVVGDALKLGAAEGLSAEQVAELYRHFNPGNMVPFAVERIGSSAQGATSFALTMARKDVRLMLETIGEGAQVLPAVATAMDAAIAEGKGERDFAIFAR